MSGCKSCGSTSKHAAGGGPFSTGRELVEFVCNAHGGTVKNKLIDGGGYAINCHGCNEAFTLITFVGQCPKCGGVHAIAPVHKSADHIQFAGKDFVLE